MEAFQKLNKEEKGQAFAAAGNQLGLPAYIIEKDFHVTVVLGCLFGPIWQQLKAGNTHDPFVFKGGTTLSKVYSVIERMSEDIDLALSMSFLGYPEPDQESPNQREKKRLPHLKKAAETFTQNKLLSMLQTELDKAAEGYSVSIAVDTEDALVVNYPKLCEEYDADAYIKPRVLVESGGRAAQLPNAWHMIKPMVASVAEEANVETNVMTLSINRTFFEKVTAVHAFINQKKIESRSSRHLYDIVKIALSHPEVVTDTAMLVSVVEHKKKYFRAGAAKYDLATQAELRLVPATEEQYKAFINDWGKMQDMFADSPPVFSELISQLDRLERLINCCVTFPADKVIDLLIEHDINYELIAKIYPLLRSHNINNAHSISLRLSNMKKSTSQDNWDSEMREILQSCIN
ncbi:MAG: nucleotidyl transferase AbiEii/AbiGii toxin family protein [Neptuniibacter sp.]